MYLVALGAEQYFCWLSYLLPIRLRHFHIGSTAQLPADDGQDIGEE